MRCIPYLTQVVQDIEAAQQAVQGASDVDAATIAAEDLRRRASFFMAHIDIRSTPWSC